MTIEECNIDNNILFCACGCGQTRLNKDKQGRLVKFIWGHQNRGKNHPMWRGGKKIDIQGYILIKNPNHPYCNKHGYVREHRLIMEKYLGRYLDPKESIHHINKNRQDNRIENLMLFETLGEHTRYEFTQDLSNRICYLCNSKDTYIDKRCNRPKWFNYKDNNIICCKCYKKDRYYKTRN